MFKKMTIYLMSIFYIYIGTRHFTDPNYFLAIMILTYIGQNLFLAYA